jgi:hypothetical protein
LKSGLISVANTKPMETRQGNQMKILRYLLRTLLTLSLLFAAISMSNGQPLVINELMSSNNSFILDEDGDDSDWIEVYNTTNDVIDLSGYFLSDKDGNPQGWAFPDTIIQPKHFLLVFASGKNRATAGSELHTNFSIKASGEPVLISHLGEVVHRMPPINLETNTSYGLENDGRAPFVVFYEPTPGASNNQAPVAASVFFSKQGGIYQNTFALSIFCDSDQASIYYTTDGTSPTTSSYLYTGQLQLSTGLCSGANISQMPIYPPGSFKPPPPGTVPKAVVIRAVAFDQNGNQISDVVSNSYFIHDLGINHNQLPIISICAEHDDLFDFETGIFVPGKHWDANEPTWTGNYYQRGREWEREINLEYHEQNKVGINHRAGLRTHGGNGRRLSQKGMRLYARDEYGASYFEHPFFEDKPIVNYKRLVLKPFYASWSQTGIEDYVSLKMARNLNVDHVGTQAVVVYLNGEYWGIYYLQERIDSRYIEGNYGVERDMVDLIGNWHGMIEYGENKDFLALYDFIEQHDLGIGSNYETVSKWMDIDNFIDYQLFEIYIANADWPGNNMKCWRERDSEGKWRWIYFDGDAALQNYKFDGFSQALKTSGYGYPTKSTATLFLWKLLENDGFKSQFLNRLQELLNNQLSYSGTNPIYQEAIENMSSEIQRQINRFSFPNDYDRWYNKVLKTKEFLTMRNCIIANQVSKVFNERITVGNCNYEEVAVTELGLYPNPNHGEFTITFYSSEAAPAYIKIHNPLGREVASFNQVIPKGENTLTYHLKDIPNGLLFVSVGTEKQLFGTTMIKLGR